MKITIETIQNKKLNEVNELFYNSFLQYGKKTADYIASKHDMSKEYCAMYIASGLYTLYIERYEQLKEVEPKFYERLIMAYYGTRKLVKKIMAITNYSSYFKNNAVAYETTENTIYKLPKYKKSKNQYSEYRNIKKVNSHVIDIIDILEQKENRSHKKELSIDNETYDFRNNIVSYYPTPEQELLNKLSRAYSAQFASKIRNDKNYNRVLFLKDKHNKNVTLSNTENHFLYDFKKRYGLEVLTSKELFYIVSNY